MHWTSRERQVSPEKLAESRGAIDSQLAAGALKPLERLKLLQSRRDIDVQLASLTDETAMSSVEAGIITHAASYGQRKEIQYATWREACVPADLLANAGISPGQQAPPAVDRRGGLA